MVICLLLAAEDGEILSLGASFKRDLCSDVLCFSLFVLPSAVLIYRCLIPIADCFTPLKGVLRPLQSWLSLLRQLLRTSFLLTFWGSEKSSSWICVFMCKGAGACESLVLELTNGISSLDWCFVLANRKYLGLVVQQKRLAQIFHLCVFYYIFLWPIYKRN